MMEEFQSLVLNADPAVRGLLPVAIGIGALFVYVGIVRAFSVDDPALVRMRRAGDAAKINQGKQVLLKSTDPKPKGLFRALIPDDPTELTQIKLQLRHAGLTGPNAVRNFFLMRLGLALLGPVTLFGLFTLHDLVGLPMLIAGPLMSLSNFNILQVVMVTLAAGFYLPGLWLKSQIKARQERIEQAFPNTLDLLQISVEAGMGFDAAMSRVGNEMGRVCPEISEELLMAQQEILAGRDRELTLFNMADRMGIEEAKSFVNVMVQSIQYGTSVSAALNGYAIEMRENRELRAQERANKLPVQMSGVMAVLMLPALFMITLGPTIIRYIDM